ncbi:hypothetical protein, partial [Thermogutta sp.]|uniref:hypothetical protein n=1 Tax=Thermogutta sp. TaxID=1962930 RepID=UPI003C7DEA04
MKFCDGDTVSPRVQRREGPLSTPGWSRWSSLVWALVYLCLALWGYRHSLITGALPASRPANGVVTLFNVWTIWWNADRLSHGLKNYWDAPIFWPEKGTFAFSEPQPLTAIVAPVVWTCGPVAAFHVYLVGALVLNGVFARVLVRRWSGDPWGSGYAGALVVWLPLVLQQPELIQYASLWPILWQWDVILRTLDRPMWRHSLEFALAWALTFASSVQLGLFSAVVLGLVVPWFFIGKGSKGLCVWLSGVGLGMLLILPLGLPMSRILSQHRVVRPAEVVDALSATVRQWLAPPPHGLDTCLGTFRELGGRRLNPGWLICLLAVGATATAALRGSQPPSL